MKDEIRFMNRGCPADCEGTKKQSGSNSDLIGLLSAVAERRRAECEAYSKELQVGRCGSDDGSYHHGRWDGIEEVLDDIDEILGR